MHHDNTLYVKLIGIVVATFFVQTTAIAKNLAEISGTAGVVPSTTKFDRQQLNLISQNASSKVDEYDRLGKQKYEKGDYKGALADYDRAIQIDPNNVNAHARRGVVKMSAKDYQGALVDLNRAIELDSSYVKAYINRGVLKAFQFADNRGALADFDRAIQLDPNNLDASNNRALHKYHNLKDRVGGIADLQKAAQLLQQQGERKEAQRVMGIVKQWQLETKKAGNV